MEKYSKPEKHAEQYKYLILASFLLAGVVANAQKKPELPLGAREAIEADLDEKPLLTDSEGKPLIVNNSDYSVRNPTAEDEKKRQEQMDAKRKSREYNLAHNLEQERIEAARRLVGDMARFKLDSKETEDYLKNKDIKRPPGYSYPKSAVKPSGAKGVSQNANTPRTTNK